MISILIPKICGNFYLQTIKNDQIKNNRHLNLGRFNSEEPDNIIRLNYKDMSTLQKDFDSYFSNNNFNWNSIYILSRLVTKVLPSILISKYSMPFCLILEMIHPR